MRIGNKATSPSLMIHTIQPIYLSWAQISVRQVVILYRMTKPRLTLVPGSATGSSALLFYTELTAC